MKQIILLIAVTMVFSCKSEKKNNQKLTNAEETMISEKKEYEVVNSVILPGKNLWLFNRILFEKKGITQVGEQSYSIARTSFEQTAYTMTPEIPINYGSLYKINLTVRRGEKSHFFGLRAVGQYPNRVDAVFDLKNGLVKEIKSSGEFVKGNASITSTGNGWYNCSIICELDTDSVKLIFGPTNESIRTEAWESKTTELLDIEIIPESLTLEEISN